MNRALADLLAGGDDLFAALEAITSDCLQRLQTIQPREIEAFLEERSSLLAAIQGFIVRLDAGIAESGIAVRDPELEQFRQRQAAVLQRVIETDGLLIAIARSEASSLQKQLADISRGRTALNGYRNGGGENRVSLKGTA